MTMSQTGRGYRSNSRVVEYVSDRLLTWESGGYSHGSRIVGGQWWRYTLHPHPGGTKVDHAYVWAIQACR